MTAKDASNAIAQVILEALQQGDKNRGELFDLTDEGYPAIVQTLQQLKDKKLIESYFVPAGGISILTYRLHSGN